MYVRVRLFGKPEEIVVVESKLTKIEKFRCILQDKFGVPPKLQRLFYGGKLLDDGYTFHDYNIKRNDVIQFMLRAQVEKSPEKKITETEPQVDSKKKVEYKDAESELFTIGDLIDMRDREEGGWFEGEIVAIVQKNDPDVNSTVGHNGSTEEELPLDSEENKALFDKEHDIENQPPEQNKDNSKVEKVKIKEVNILYKVQLNEQNDCCYCKLSEIRPRARNVIKLEDVKVGQKVMINHNPEHPLEKGYWYDFKVSEVIKLRTNYELKGILYLSPDTVLQSDLQIKVHDKIFAIEEVVPLAQRTDEYKKMMITPTDKRTQPLNCLQCRDQEDVPCKECSCFLCAGKEFPEKTLLCDECNKGFHIMCLTPPLTDLPEEDWYCPDCKRDPNEVIAPGASKQTKKQSTKSRRDWGRGMACAGKTKTSSMPPNHFGPIPGIEVGMSWRYRIQLSELGVHRPPVSGIHGRDVEGAYSIVLSGGYEDDVDNGYEFTYTGSGGRDLSGNKRTALQSSDQTLTRENRALARNCAVERVSLEGGDAGENWRKGKPVRVVRSCKMRKHFPKYAPKDGIRYDGIYKVVKYYPEEGLSGFRVWKYLLRRDDPAPAPWEPNAKQFPVTLPDGYLEAEAMKEAQRASRASVKRSYKEANDVSLESDGEDSTSIPRKKLKSNDDSPKKKGRRSKKKSPFKSPSTHKGQINVASIFKQLLLEKSDKSEVESALSNEERELIDADAVNAKLWRECLEICEKQGKKEFVEHVTQVFLCIICQDVAVNPVTTPCLHNFCTTCLKQAFKGKGPYKCPCCRNNLEKYKPEPNEALKAALRCILLGYDAGKK